MPPKYTPAQLLAHLRNVYGPQRADADAETGLLVYPERRERFFR